MHRYRRKCWGGGGGGSTKGEMLELVFAKMNDVIGDHRKKFGNWLCAIVVFAIIIMHSG